jgi:hypothetical protein
MNLTHLIILKRVGANRQALNNELKNQNIENECSMKIIKTDEAKTCYKN